MQYGIWVHGCRSFPHSGWMQRPLGRASWREPYRWEALRFQTIEEAQAHLDYLRTMSDAYPAWYFKLYEIRPFQQRPDDSGDP